MITVRWSICMPVYISTKWLIACGMYCIKCVATDVTIMYTEDHMEPREYELYCICVLPLTALYVPTTGLVLAI